MLDSDANCRSDSPYGAKSQQVSRRVSTRHAESVRHLARTDHQQIPPIRAGDLVQYVEAAALHQQRAESFRSEPVAEVQIDVLAALDQHFVVRGGDTQVAVRAKMRGRHMQAGNAFVALVLEAHFSVIGGDTQRGQRGESKLPQRVSVRHGSVGLIDLGVQDQAVVAVQALGHVLLSRLCSKRTSPSSAETPSAASGAKANCRSESPCGTDPLAALG